MGFFDLFSGKDDTPPAPEERIIPEFAKNIKSPIEGWITSQVFIDPEDKNKRLYYAAQGDGDTWEILYYSYVAGDKDKPCRTERRFSSDESIAEAIAYIARLEKGMLQEGYVPVDVLRGNYREAANLNGAYFDDKDHYISLTKDEAVIVKEALLDRKGIQALYNKVSEKPAEPAIKTWDDFYREIVHAYSQEYLLSDQVKQDPNFPKVMEYISNMLVLMHTLENKMMSERERLQMEKSVSPVSGDYFYKLAAKINWSSTEKVYDNDGGTPKIVSDYEAARLTGMMRMGANLYQKLTTSLSVDADELNLLSHIGETISAFAEERLNCPPEQAKQLANVIMQGPDPYADKPLPLEIFFNKYKDQLSTEPKTKPKNPGL